MYPKVKVREDKEYDDQYDLETRSLQSLKGLQSLCLDDFSSPDDSPKSVVRVPWLDSSMSAPSASAKQGHSASTNKGAIISSEKNALEEKTTNIRASPILRPRAVLSSPDNDGMITNKNRRREELHSTLKTQNRCQHRQIEHKVKPKATAADAPPLPTKKDHEKVSDAKRDHRAARQRKVTFDVSQKVGARNGKP